MSGSYVKLLFMFCSEVSYKICGVFFTGNWRKHFASIRAIITGPCLIKVFLNFECIKLFFCGKSFLDYTVTYKRGDIRTMA